MSFPSGCGTVRRPHRRRAPSGATRLLAAGRKGMVTYRRHGWRSLRPILERLEDLTLLSSILGAVWDDLNGDGVRQAGEPGPVTVAVVSPVGLQVPNLPTLFAILPGEHFQGTFDQQATTPATLATRPLAPGTYRPQQFFTDPLAHIYDGDPNGTWGLVFF